MEKRRAGEGKSGADTFEVRGRAKSIREGRELQRAGEANSQRRGKVKAKDKARAKAKGGRSRKRRAAGKSEGGGILKRRAGEPKGKEG